MSEKTATLKINTGEYSRFDYSGWIHYYDLYAGRDSAGTYWFSKLSFNTNGLKIKKSKTLTISHTVHYTSNPYGTSAILTTSELTPSQVHNLTTEAKVTAVSGYVSYTNCDSHTYSENQSKGTVFYYTFDTDKLKSNTTYYIYIKRRVGLANAVGSTNGWTEYYNPCEPGYESYSSLKITYESGGNVNIHDGTKFRKYAAYIHDGTNFRRYTAYVHNGTEWVPYSG